MATQVLAAGMQVEAQRGHAVHWFPGKISSVNRDAKTYTIRFDEGSVEIVKHSKIRKLRNDVQNTKTGVHPSKRGKRLSFVSV